ncbi:type II toxin-antitoxin system VapC family toxin [Patescibacteria group bacterium]|nr:type II toxin-antitoxin system VapC family toxin [Patescibacteria group bacterium]
MTIRVALDTALVAALIDAEDKWHATAVGIRDALKAANAEVFHLDCVINELISVLGRRLIEQKRSDQFIRLINDLEQLVPSDQITWVSPETPRLYPQIIALVRSHGGQLNFHDALIALACQELGIGYIATFDRDFDRISWLSRLGAAGDVPH